eukprot:Sspe_Gene.39271::Locus_18943_Transcript_1_1_Confidence_1.000_Length_2248::g.39271::m.39271
MDEDGEISPKRSRMRSRTMRGKQDSKPGSDDFNPREYIIRELGTKSFDDLIREMERSREKERKDLLDMKTLVASHITTFIACKDAVENLYTSDKDLFSKATLQPLLAKQERVAKECAETFEPLFQRDERLAELKGVSQVLDKYQFLFNMPSAIQQYIAEKEYRKVVHDYRRVKHFKKEQRAGGKGSELISQAFLEVDGMVEALRKELLQELRETDLMDTTQVEHLLSVLKDLECHDLLRDFLAGVEGRMQSALEKVEDDFKVAMHKHSVAKMRAKEHDDQWSELKRRSRSSLQLRRRTSLWSGKVADNTDSISQPIHNVINSADESNREKEFISLVKEVGDPFEVNEALNVVRNSGKEMVGLLVTCHNIVQRQWDDKDRSPEIDAQIEALFEACAGRYKRHVWPIVVQCDPILNNAAASLQQWRSALLLITRATSVVIANTSSSSSLGKLRDDCQMHFVQRSCERLTNHIASWAADPPSKVGYYTSRQYLSTELPLRFERAALSLLELWSESDELRPNTEQLEAIRFRFNAAHRQFLDLIYLLAFREDPDGSENIDQKEERMLILWADLLVFKNIVCKTTFAAFQAQVGADGLRGGQKRDTLSLSQSAMSLGVALTDFSVGRQSYGSLSHNAQSPSTSPLHSPRAPSRTDGIPLLEPHGNAELTDLIASLQNRLIDCIIENRVRWLSHKICITAFMRPDLNWSYAAEPKSLRSYVTDILLLLVSVHEATMRLTL